MSEITSNTRVAEIVQRCPNARAIFDRHGLKGCGGEHGPSEHIGQSLATFGSPVLAAAIGFKWGFWTFGALLVIWLVIFAALARNAPNWSEYFPKSVGGVTGLVGAAGGLGGFFAPLVLGIIKQQTASFTWGFVLLCGFVVALCLPFRP